MPSNYLTVLENFYKCTGTGGLTDLVGGINFTEMGVVPENTNDGPPPEPNGSSRGPCGDPGDLGFRKLSAFGYLDVRSGSGVLPRTLCAWVRHDALDSDQRSLNFWDPVGGNQHYLMGYEAAFDTAVLHINGGAGGNVDSAVTPEKAFAVGEWCFYGFSYDGNGNVYVHANGGTTHASTSFGGFKNGSLPASGMEFGRDTSSGGPGLKGDIAYIMNFSYGFKPPDWRHFWRAGNGRLYPNGFKRVLGAPMLGAA